MITKSEILKWFCRKSECLGRDEGFCIEFIGCDNKRQCDDYTELSAMLDELIESVPCEKVDFAEGINNLKQRQFFMRAGWNNHVDKVAEWKKEAGK